MTSKTHDLIAFGSLLTVVSYYPPQNLNLPTFFTCLVANILGSLAPDLDQATNRLWDLLPAGNTVGRIFRKLFLGHRTLSHSLLGIYLIYQLLLFILPKLLNTSYINTDFVVISFMIGFVIHIFTDAFTKEGIPLFFPLSFNIGIPPIKFLRLKTGKFTEKYIIFPLVCLYIVSILYFKKDVFWNLMQLLKG
jgi:inner membrane protein